MLKNRKKVSYEIFVPKVGVGISKSKMKGPNGRNVVIGINMHPLMFALFYDFRAHCEMNCLTMKPLPIMKSCSAFS